MTVNDELSRLVDSGQVDFRENWIILKPYGIQRNIQDHDIERFAYRLTEALSKLTGVAITVSQEFKKGMYRPIVLTEDDGVSRLEHNRENPANSWPVPVNSYILSVDPNCSTNFFLLRQRDSNGPNYNALVKMVTAKEKER